MKAKVIHALAEPRRVQEAVAAAGEELLDCRVGSVAELQALGVARRDHPLGAESSRRPYVIRDLPATRGLGTTLERPPGALLSVRGERAQQVVVLLQGRAALVRDGDVTPVEQGWDFGAHAVLESRRHVSTMVATSPVQVHVLSRAEFNEVTTFLPAVAEELLTHDLDR